MTSLNSIFFGSILTDFENWLNANLPSGVQDIIIKLLIGLAIIIIGFMVAGQFVRLLNQVLKRRNVDETLRPFLRNVLKYLLYGLVIIIAASTMGLEMTSIVGVVASLGLAIGLALQGALANFAGGVLIMILKPFKVGDFIEAQGHSGHVKEVNVVSTSLLTLDFKTVYIPNGPLAGGSITNYTKEEVRRCDLTFGVSYDDDIDKVRKIILDTAAKMPKILDKPDAPFVRVINHNSSSVDFTCRLWCKVPDYWDVYFFMMEEVKKAFDANDITIPFPQMDVHMDKN